MIEGVYNNDDPDEIQKIPDFMVSLCREWKDVEYGDYQLKVEVVNYLDGSTRVNAVKFLNRLDEIEFLESFDEKIDKSLNEKCQKFWKRLESMLC